MPDPSETLDIEQATARWEELIDRVEVGESFLIAVHGIPKAKLEPVPTSSDDDRTT